VCPNSPPTSASHSRPSPNASAGPHGASSTRRSQPTTPRGLQLSRSLANPPFVSSGVVAYPHDRPRTPIARSGRPSTFAAPGSTLTNRSRPVLASNPLCIQGKPTGALRPCKRVMSPSGSNADRTIGAGGVVRRA
jgi:hypothetical protein